MATEEYWGSERLTSEPAEGPCPHDRARIDQLRGEFRCVDCGETLDMPEMMDAYPGPEDKVIQLIVAEAQEQKAYELVKAAEGHLQRCNEFWEAACTRKRELVS